MTEKCAWVTLATNDAYSLGALVLAHSLRRVGTQHELVILITPSVTPIMRERLQSVFSEVVTVDVLDSKDAAHLALLSRPELGITFTKIHCWNLTQYKKCVFLDADTLVFQNCDELFEREELSAAPDVGWPDCFNSGVFVYQPSNATFDALIKFAQEKGSFDGGDQGLLNQFFSSWAREDIRKHLPFVYNVCSTAFYSYLPALKQYGSDMKIMHFIGNLKPWLQKFNWSSRTVAEQGYLQAPLQYWWDIFLDKVHPCLDATMAGIAGALSQLTIGTSEQGSAVDEHLRRQGWESGNIDYLGADAFDNIWAKISQTLSSPPPPSAPSQIESSPAPVEAIQTSEKCEIPTQCSIVSEPPKSIPVEKKDSPPPPALVEAAPTQPSKLISQVSSPVPEQPAAPKVKTETVKVTEKPVEKTIEKPAPEPSTIKNIPSPQAVEQPSSQAEQVQKASKDSKAIIEEQDSKQAEKEAESILAKSLNTAPPPKQIEKLVCHLTPIGEAEPLVTPENEHEDAASIAQSIIAGEEALSTPTIISATPPATAITCPIIPQNIKDLSIDTTIPETPPVPGPVSLAQIGVIPTSRIEKTEKEDVKIDKCSEETKQETVIECKIKPQKKDETVILCEFRDVQKIESPSEISVAPFTIDMPKDTCDIKQPPIQKPTRSEKSKTEKIVELESQPEKDLKSSVSVDSKSTKPKAGLSKQSSTDSEKKIEPSSPKEEIAPPHKTKKSHKTPKAQPPTDTKALPETVPSAEVNIDKVEAKSKISSSVSSEPIVSCEISSGKEAVKEIETPKETIVKDTSSELSVEKPKKAVKKPQPTPKEKADDSSVPKSSSESESIKKSEDKPVPPPRKKEKKPKDKK